MRWPFTRYGTGTLLLVSGVLLLAALALSRLPGAWWVAPLPLLAFILNFFRDPERRAPGGEDELVAPADGLVSDILQVDDPDLGERCTRIGIFLSVFDVHVNRTSCAGEIVAVSHREGQCLDARHPKATELNRAATIVLRRPDGRRLALRQITGKIARRIVCPVVIGQFLGRGQRYGMIRFGSRTELIVPQDELSRVLVAAGQKVKGGQTILAELRPARGAPPAEPGRAVASGRM